MKTLLLFCLAFTLSASFHYKHSGAKPPEKYCVKMKGGKKVVMHRGRILTHEVTLNNGDRIQVDGTVLLSDGNINILRAGDCLTEDGVVDMEKRPAE